MSRYRVTEEGMKSGSNNKVLATMKHYQQYSVKAKPVKSEALAKTLFTDEESIEKILDQLETSGLVEKVG